MECPTLQSKRRCGSVADIGEAGIAATIDARTRRQPAGFVIRVPINTRPIYHQEGELVLAEVWARLWSGGGTVTEAEDPIK